MDEINPIAWHAFKDVCREFLRKHQESQRECIVENLAKYYQNFGCNLSLKVN